MPEVRCEAATCLHHKDGCCAAPTVLIINKEFGDTDVMVCSSYVYNPFWWREMLKAYRHEIREMYLRNKEAQTNENLETRP